MPPTNKITPESKAHLATILVAHGAASLLKDVDAVAAETNLTPTQIRSQLADNRANIRRHLAQAAQALASGQQ